MKPLLFMLVFLEAIASTDSAMQLSEAIVASSETIAMIPSGVGARSPTPPSSASDYILEENRSFGTSEVSFVRVVEKGVIVQIGWSPADGKNAPSFAKTFATLHQTLLARGFINLSYSAAVNGEVVFGDAMSHPVVGYSYRLGLVDRDRRVRVDLEYLELGLGSPCRWKVTISSGVVLPIAPSANY